MNLRDIDLIPPEVGQRRRLIRAVGSWLVVVALGLAAISGGAGVLRARLVHDLRPSTGLAEADTQLRQIIADIESVKVELEGMSFAHELARRRSYGGTIWEISKVMNPGTRLSQLNMRAGSVGQEQVSLVGLSISNAELGDFLSQLSRNGMFRNVELKFAEEYRSGRRSGKAGEAQELIRFEISCIVSAR